MRYHVSRGLTLVELLVVVGMMSISAAIVIPSMGQTGVLRVQAAARTIVSDITLAQTEAMAFQVRRGIYFGAVPDGNGGFEKGNGYVVAEPTVVPLSIGNLSSYALRMPDDPSRDYARDFTRDATKFGGSVIDSPSFDDDGVLLFDELGAPLRLVAPDDGGAPEALPGNGGSVTVTSKDLGIAYRVTVDTMTGRVDVSRVDEADGDAGDE